jgi:hypothetical protein
MQKISLDTETVQPRSMSTSFSRGAPTAVYRIRQGFTLEALIVRFQVARISAEKTREQVLYIVTSRRAGEWRYSQRERITTRWFELTTPPSRVFDLQKQHESPN